ncbi:MAG TPA: lytic transglycosylase domain-containing protein [Bryobacteraceae bacterium]|nr:lytic transglycosylase domain-containing protein [Bryobacteraceae bacterium]
MRLEVVLLFLSGCAAQVVPQAAEDARAAMEASIAKQRAAIEVQREAIARHAAALPVITITGPTAAVMPAAEPLCDPIQSRHITPMVQRAASVTGLAPDLLSAVIATESAGRPCAVSPKGAQGLMQLMPETAAMLGVKDPFEPVQNIDGGARYLSDLLERYGGDLPLALAAYNAGPGRVDAVRGLPPFRETVRYVDAVLARLESARSRRPAPE